MVVDEDFVAIAEDFEAVDRDALDGRHFVG